MKNTGYILLVTAALGIVFYLESSFKPFLRTITRIPKYIISIITLVLLVQGMCDGTETVRTVNDSLKSKKRRRVSQLTKKIVASNQKWKCKHCDDTLDFTYEVDHIIPLYQGGTNQVENLQALCRNCHGRKTMLGRNKSQ
tara:strand:- start:1557 stop:1976 length:420 start_codon:yes stop_codon:yes gene_type:complete